MPGDATRFAGRVAVVTGAASGIGKATALRLAREGARVAAVDRHLAGAEETAAAIRAGGGTARAYACDVADSAQVAAAAQATLRDLGPVDVLANVAGIGDAVGSDITELDEARWNHVLAVNLSGAFYRCRELLPGMDQRVHGGVMDVSELDERLTI